MNILIIGTGHMGKAILKAIVQNYNQDKQIYIFNRTVQKSIDIAKKYNCYYIQSLEELNDLKIDIFIIGVRPENVNKLLTNLDNYNISNKLIISMVNAYSINQIQANFNKSNNLSIIRMMPNMNAINFKFTTGYCSNNVNNNLINKGLKILQACGSVYKIEENHFSSFTAATGCSPAYIFSFIKGFMKFCEEQNFDFIMAKEFVTEVIINTVQNYKQSNNNLEDLIDQICVPNGSTIEGQNVLNNKGFTDILIESLNAAKSKS